MRDDPLELVRGWIRHAKSPPRDAGSGLEWAAESDTTSLIEAILAASGDARDASRRYYEAFWAGPGARGRQLHERAVDWLLADLHRRGVDLEGLPGVEESPLFSDLAAAQRRGRRVTAELLVLLQFAVLADAQLGPRRAGQVVLEVGGAYGELARLVRLLAPGRPPHTHVLVDVPEALAMSYLFLAQTFPGEPMLLVRSASELRDAEAGKHRFIFVPVGLAAGLAGRAVDLVISTAALGGAQSTGITGWLAFAQQTLRPAKLIALERFLNTDRPGLSAWRPPSVAAAATSYDARWRVLAWELEPSYLSCPYATRLYPRCFHLVAERTPQPEAAQARARSDELFADAEDSVWARHFDGDALEGTRWDNTMVRDGGMGGITFKLWESVRLCPRPQNLRLMLQHIDDLQCFEGKCIEETAGYEERLARVVAEGADPVTQKEFAAWMCDRLRDRADPASMANYLRVILPQCKGMRIVCYGVGRDFEAMAAAGIFAGADVVGVIDDRRPAGSVAAGFRVLATPELAEAKPDVIIATSSRFGAALRERAAGIITALGLKAQVR